MRKKPRFHPKPPPSAPAPVQPMVKYIQQSVGNEVIVSMVTPGVPVQLSSPPLRTAPVAPSTAPVAPSTATPAPSTASPAQDTATAAPKAAPAAPAAAAPTRVVLLNIRTASKILGSPARWLILQELARAEALPVQYLAAAARTERTATSRHMSILLKAGLVEVTYGRLYRLAPLYRACVAHGYLDLGPCRLVIAPPTAK